MTFDEFWKLYVGGDKDKSLETGRIYAESAWNYQQARIEALRAEVEEQARLLGASASREAELLARVEALEKKEAVLYSGYDVLVEVRKEQPNFEITHVSDVLDAVVRLQKAALLQEPTK